MKNIIILFTACLLSIHAIAQDGIYDEPFRTKKTEDSIGNQSDNYNNKPNKVYSPLAAGVYAYVFPGLGHFYCGENIRGLNFLVGEVCIIGVGLGTAGFMLKNDNESGATGMFLLSGICLFGVHIWSIGDAYMQCKMKNNYNRSNSITQLDLSISPQVNRTDRGDYSTGLSLKLNL